MKKKLKSLKLNKKSVSNLNPEVIKAGGIQTFYCTGLMGSCWCQQSPTYWCQL